MDVGIWIRVSTDDQKNSDSPEIHELRAKEFCKQRKYKIVKKYDLAGISGKSVMNQPECKRMIADVEAGVIKGLVFSSMSRLARNLRELLEFDSIFRNHGAVLHSIDGQIDTSTPNGRMVFAMSGAMAQFEREQDSLRVIAGMLTRAKEGRKVSGQQPFGYVWKDKYNLVIDEDKATIVRKAYQLFIEHQKIKRVITILNDAGFHASKSLWTPKSMKRLLVNPIYTGTYQRNYTRSKGNKKSWEFKDKTEWIPMEVEPILTQEVWDNVQHILATRPQIYSEGVPKEGRYLFSGILRCECGKKLYVAPYRAMTIPRYVCTTCKNKISEDVLLEHFLPKLQEIVVNPDELKADADTEALLAQKADELKVLKGKRVKNQNRIDSLFELFTDKMVTKAVFGERHAPLDELKEQISAEIERLELDLVKLRQTEVGRQHVINQAQSLALEWLELAEDERRRIVRVLLNRVNVGQEIDTEDGKTQDLEFVFAFDFKGYFDNLPPTDRGSNKKGAHPQGFIAATNISRDG
jgi:site-specific DNA recombinase